MTVGSLILAPLRGVTIRCFRETFAKEIAEAGFTEAVTPFVTANAGVDPLKDREIASTVHLRPPPPSPPSPHLLVTPQFIGKDPVALRHCLERIRSVGYTTADLNCGCPFPMVRNKGRGSGLLRTPDVLRQMMEVGCEVMGPGRFSVKARLGVDRTDELLGLMPLINAFPLRCLTVHARTARQMYEGVCDLEALKRIRDVATVPLVLNGDIPFPRPALSDRTGIFASVPLMLGRGFVRYLGTRPDAKDLLLRYIAASESELSGERPVLGRMKELLSYWKDQPKWRRRWNVIKICRTLDELKGCLS